MTGRVLFVSEHALERAENLHAVWDAYDGPKDYKRGIWHMRTAPQDGYAAVVCDSLPEFMPAKRNCKSVVIGHGITGDKKYALDEKRGGIDKRAFAQIDASVNPSTKTVDIMARQFGIPAERVYPLGMPRTDAYFEPRAKTEGRMYFYAPTFRGPNDGRRLPVIDWAKVDGMLQDDERIVVKRHYFQREPLLDGEYDHIVEADPDRASTPYLLDCDVLLTDYSSIVLDAYVAGKPSVLTVDDMNEYMAMRGMYMEYPEGYGSRWLHATGNERLLVEELRAAAAEGMTDMERGLVDRVADMCDGHSSERVCELVRSMACGC